MTNSGYVVHYQCHICGHMHPVAAPLSLPGGPGEPCTLADVYPGSNLPPRIVRFLTDSLFWCDQAGETIEAYGRPGVAVPFPPASTSPPAG